MSRQCSILTLSQIGGVVVDIGVPIPDSGFDGGNVLTVAFDPITVFYHTFVLTNVASEHRFGFDIARIVDGSGEKLSINKRLYGETEAVPLSGVEAFSPLPTTGIVVRARMHGFDTEDNIADPRGLVALQGLAATISDSGAGALGIASIS